MKTSALLYGCSDPPELSEMCVAESSRLGVGICNVGLAVENVRSAMLDARNHIIQFVRLKNRALDLNAQFSRVSSATCLHDITVRKFC